MSNYLKYDAQGRGLPPSEEPNNAGPGRIYSPGAGTREWGNNAVHLKNTAAAGSFEQNWCANLATGLATLIVLWLGPASALAAAPSSTAPLDGEQLYRRYCAQCHSKSRALRVPQFNILRRMQPQGVLDALEVGSMRFQGFQRTVHERRAIAEFITGKKLAQEQEGKETLAGRCPDGSAKFDPASGPQWNGWGAGLANARFQSAKAAGLKSDQIQRLRVKWAFGFPPNTLLSQPTVIGGRIFVGALRGRVYSIDAAKGCLHWSVKTAAGVRTAMSVGMLPGNNPPRSALYFGDVSANVYAVDAKTGEQVWTARADDHPMARVTGAPVLYANHLFVPVSSAEEGTAAGSGVSMLYISRQPCRAGRADRQKALAELHDSAKTAAHPPESARRPVMGTCGSRSMVGADDRHTTWGDLSGYGR